MSYYLLSGFGQMSQAPMCESFMTGMTVKSWQQLMKDGGVYFGPVDGLVNKEFLNKIQEFTNSYGINWDRHVSSLDHKTCNQMFQDITSSLAYSQSTQQQIEDPKSEPSLPTEQKPLIKIVPITQPLEVVTPQKKYMSIVTQQLKPIAITATEEKDKFPWMYIAAGVGILGLLFIGYRLV